jgi:microcompartment protein CcmK/EutM
MILGKVIGNVVSTIRAKGYGSKKILLIKPIDPDGNTKGTAYLAIDTVQAGVGDIVLTLDEGGSARVAINESETFTIKLVIVGIVDDISVK